MRLGAVVIAYNSAEHIGDCLDSSLRFASDFEAGILVIDNASTDGTVERSRSHSGVQTVENRENRGFAGAVNQGFQILNDAEAILILNPDVILLDSPSKLAAELTVSNVAAVGGKLLDREGRAQAGFQVRRFPTAATLVFENLGLNRLCKWNPVNRRYRCFDLDPALPANVEQPAGACLLVRRAAWQAVGGMDEGFFPVWFEDVDFLKRLAAAGWKSRYVAAFSARHAGGHSVQSVEWGQRQLYWCGSLLRYAAIHCSTIGLWAVGISMLLGWVPRAVTGMFLQRSLRCLTEYEKMFRLVGAYLWQGRSEARLP
ncbi:glycosyltransferase family 2 protein [uncultured Paludibaculum sp.]|uniref:glycosyltransferase family 2 protein n=1 Tax=uncultured Paludibaculum sp. TaxID=1765020 RepID=UPI002AAA6EC0|nr:glycosyltransferase family 2 protein [uncultured Paludibaculum sp.]